MYNKFCAFFTATHGPSEEMSRYFAVYEAIGYSLDRMNDLAHAKCSASQFMQ